MINIDEIDVFTKQYLETALWSSCDIGSEGGETFFDENYEIDDFSDERLKQAIEDCEAFQKENYDMISSDLSGAGHDFWLTRNGHGAGFWDGDWPEKDGKVLTDNAQAYGEIDLYSHEGKIY